MRIFQHASAMVLAALLCALPRHLVAQDASDLPDELRAQLAERDAIIIALQHSVADLQRRVTALENGMGEAVSTDSSVSRSAETTTAIAETASNTSDSSRLVVDEVAAERALERTLVQAGALLMPRGAVELTPYSSVGANDSLFQTVVDTGSGDGPGLASVDRTSYGLGLTARIGLPFDSQLELGIPYLSVTEESLVSGVSGPVTNTSQTGRGAGDFVVGVSKTLLRERGYVPDIIGRLTWNTGSGTESDNDVYLGGGFSSLSGSLSFVKRKDPLALFWSVGYQDFQDNNGVEPGNAFNFSLGTGLAISPASSLSGAITHRSIAETKVSGDRVAGSALDITALTIGFSTILRRGTLLNIYSEVGMSDDAADYALGFSLPWRVR